MVGVPFQKGFDPRRNTKGTTPSKGGRQLYTKKVIDAYQDDIFNIIGMVIQDAKDITKPIEEREFSISLTFKFAERFLTKPTSDTFTEDGLMEEGSEFSRLSHETLAKIREIILADTEGKSE
jgi:hypothetical protein